MTHVPPATDALTPPETGSSSTGSSTGSSIGIGIQTLALRRRFGDTTALDDLTLTVRPGTITGLLGRNGAGKSTLLALAAGLSRPSAGQILVDGEDPFENALTMADTQLVREGGDALETEPVADTFAYYADLREGWDAGLAAGLTDAFELDTSQRVDRLSRGQRSMVGAILGLASRAPLTIFDETYIGMDAPNRQTFYDALLTDYAEHPRTIVISSHLISEVERMFEDVVVLDRGRLLVAGNADDVRAGGVSLTGRSDVLKRLVGDREILARRDLGPTAQLTVLSAPDDDLSARARAEGVDVDGISLQDLFVHLTRRTVREES